MVYVADTKNYYTIIVKILHEKIQRVMILS